MTREDVIAESRRWLGTRWRHQGRSRSGVDCIGLIVCVARAFGISVDDRTDYPRDPSSVALLDHLRRQLVFVRADESHIGVVGVFRQAKLPCHVGIMAMRDGIPTVIHAAMVAHKVSEDPIMRGRDSLLLVEAGAFPGLED